MVHYRLQRCPMPKITISRREDQAIERVAPAYLRGARRTTQRVRWAIAQVAGDSGDAGNSVATEAPTPKPNKRKAG